MLIENNPSVMEFFQKTVRAILRKRKLKVSETTEFYLVNLLTEAVHASSKDSDPNYFEQPLAIIFGKAFSTSNIHEKYYFLRQLGDQSLYISGFFGDSLSRKIVDLDYYISMGSNAYGQLSDMARQSQRDPLQEAFDEMAIKFAIFVDLFSEISEQANITSNQDLLRLYERWLYTKSQRILKKLEVLGIHPVEAEKDFH